MGTLPNFFGKAPSIVGNNNYGGFLTPDAQQYYNESMGALSAQKQIVPATIAAEQQMMPGLQEYQRNIYQTQGQSLLGMYGNLMPQAEQMQARYGQGQMGIMGGLAQQSTANAIGSLDQTTQNIYNTFQNQALSDLQMGTGLSAQETNYAQQSARAAAQARGFNFSRQGGDLEILNTYRLGQERLKQRQATALSGMQMGMQQQQYGATTFLNPTMQSGIGFTTPGMMAGIEGSYGTLGSQFLQPESQYLANIRANRIQQENANKAAQAQVSAGKAAGVGSAVGGIATGIGLALALCWVAREVYGKEDIRWTIFRQWIYTEAPEWLFKLYAKHGEKFAEYISNKPFIKRIVKCAMDLVVIPRLNKIQELAI
jgi:hypothetical protein